MHKKKGSTVIIVLIFGFIFVMSFTAVASLLLSEHKLLEQKIDSEKAFQTAEAGLNYYRWHLAHDHEDLTGVANEPYYDPYGNLIGYYTIEVESAEYITGGKIVTICHKPGEPAERTLHVSENALSAHLAHGDYEGECGSTWNSNNNILAITVTGWTVNNPNHKRIIRARYGQPSLSKYAFVTDSNVWFAEDEDIVGTIHSNGGIRMDGTCNSLMTSLKETYICGAEHDCEDEEKPGIWGTGTKEELWDFPIADGVDFDAITLDLDEIETQAIADGEYFGDSGGYGYLVTFIDNGTFNVRKVTKLENDVDCFNGTDWVKESHSYKNSSNVGTYSIPENGLLFFADDVWVEGKIDGRATLAAARLPDGMYEDASIYIQNDITYPIRDGSSVLGLIAQKDILIPLYSEDDLIIDAALLAQKGHVFRYYYPSSYYSEAIRNSIETYGTIITNTVWTWNWVSGAGGPVTSGYETTNTIYDPHLLYGPPPSFPSEDEYEFITWEEILVDEE